VRQCSGLRWLTVNSANSCALTNDKVELANVNASLTRKLNAMTAELEALKSDPAPSRAPQKLISMFRGKSPEPPRSPAGDPGTDTEELKSHISALQANLKELHTGHRELSFQNASLKELLAKSGREEHHEIAELKREVAALKGSGGTTSPPRTLDEPMVSPDVTALQTQLQETTSRLQQVKDKAKAAVQRLRDDLDAAHLRIQELEARPAEPSEEARATIQRLTDEISALQEREAAAAFFADEAEEPQDPNGCGTDAWQRKVESLQSRVEELEAELKATPHSGPQILKPLETPEGEMSAALLAMREGAAPEDRGDSSPLTAEGNRLEAKLAVDRDQRQSSAALEMPETHDAQGHLQAELALARASLSKAEVRMSALDAELAAERAAGEALQAAADCSLSSKEEAKNIQPVVLSSEEESQRLMARLSELQTVRSREADQIQILEEQLRTTAEESQAKEAVIQQLLRKDLHAGHTDQGSWFPSFGQKAKMDPVQRQVHRILEDTTQRNLYLEDALDRLKKELSRLEHENRQLRSNLK